MNPALVLPSDRALAMRVLRYVVVIVLVEGALWFISWRAPALSTLIGPAYWVVALLFVIPVYHATRGRHPGHDRRHADRRERDPG